VDNPAQISDVVARFPRAMTALERTMAQALLDDGWEQIIARVPGVLSRLDSGALRPGVVIAVLRQAIIPVVLNPEGYLEEAIDGWTGRRDSATSTGRLLLADTDLAALYGFESQSQAFEIVLGC
jgi:hypothetical protein